MVDQNDQNAPLGSTPIGGSGQDLVAANSQGVKYLGLLVQLLRTIFPRISGTFTLAAAATTTVTDSRVFSNSVILPPTPVNAAAATLQGSAKSLYVQSVANGSFVVATANAAAAAGTEKFQYVVVNPV
jgi:hypothetical protein